MAQIEYQWQGLREVSNIYPRCIVMFFYLEVIIIYHSSVFVGFLYRLYNTRDTIL